MKEHHFYDHYFYSKPFVHISRLLNLSQRTMLPFWLFLYFVFGCFFVVFFLLSVEGSIEDIFICTLFGTDNPSWKVLTAWAFWFNTTATVSAVKAIRL